MIEKGYPVSIHLREFSGETDRLLLRDFTPGDFEAFRHWEAHCARKDDQ